MNLVLSGIAFISASVSKHDGVETILYFASAGFLIPVALSEARKAIEWMTERIDGITDRLSTVARINEAKGHASQRRVDADDDDRPST
jgi:hypothetical protein